MVAIGYALGVACNLKGTGERIGRKEKWKETGGIGGEGGSQFPIFLLPSSSPTPSPFPPCYIP